MVIDLLLPFYPMNKDAVNTYKYYVPIINNVTYLITERNLTLPTLEVDFMYLHHTTHNMASKLVCCVLLAKCIN